MHELKNPAVVKRTRAKQFLIQAFGGKCGICGYRRCHQAFNFHHLDPSKKKTEVMAVVQYAWARLVIEARKCVMLCSNCHAEVHAGTTKIPDDVAIFNEDFSVWRQFWKPAKPVKKIRAERITDIELISRIKSGDSYSAIGSDISMSATGVRKRCLRLNITAITTRCLARASNPS